MVHTLTGFLLQVSGFWGFLIGVDVASCFLGPEEAEAVTGAFRLGLFFPASDSWLESRLLVRLRVDTDDCSSEDESLEDEELDPDEEEPVDVVLDADTELVADRWEWNKMESIISIFFINHVHYQSF